MSYYTSGLIQKHHDLVQPPRLDDSITDAQAMRGMVNNR